MPDLWEKAEFWGFPEIEKTCSNLTGNVIHFVPGVKATYSDWYLICYHFGDLKRFISSGGDVNKVIFHFLSYDCGVINPLWGKKTFFERVERMKKAGIKKLISPDFSSWADMPRVVQLHNYYKSCVVTHDLIKAGFEVIPNVCFSDPKILEISCGLWGQREFIFLDYNHSSSGYLEDYLIKNMTEKAIEMTKPKYVWAYTGSKKAAHFIYCLCMKKNINLQVIASRVYVLRRMGVVNSRKRKEVKKCQKEEAVNRQ